MPPIEAFIENNFTNSERELRVQYGGRNAVGVTLAHKTGYVTRAKADEIARYFARRLFGDANRTVAHLQIGYTYYHESGEEHKTGQFFESARAISYPPPRGVFSDSTEMSDEHVSEYYSKVSQIVLNVF